MRKALIAVFVWGILGLAVPTWADELRIVTGGSIGGNDDSYSFWLTGNGFQISGDGPSINGPWTVCSIGAPCASGTSLNLSATVIPSAIGDAATVDGQVYEGYNYMGGVFMSGQFSITAGNIIVPAVAPGTSESASTPFTFTGVLSGYDNFGFEGTPLFTLNLAGRGTAVMAFGDFLGGSAMSIGYGFEDTAPVPEPATIFLIGSGLCGLALRRRRNLA